MFFMICLSCGKCEVGKYKLGKCVFGKYELLIVVNLLFGTNELDTRLLRDSSRNLLES